MKKILTIILFNLIFCNISNASFDWIKNQTEYTDANQLFFDSEKRFLKLIESNVSSKSFPPFTGTEGTLIEKFKRILGGPPNEVVYYEDKRYVVTSSCEAKACPVKAFVFIDTKEKYIIGLIREWEGELYIFSQAHKLYSDLPEIFFRSVIDWSKKFDIKSTQVFFIGSDEILRQAE